MLSRRHGNLNRFDLPHIVLRSRDFKYIVLCSDAGSRDIGDLVDSTALILKVVDLGRIRGKSGAARRLIRGIQSENRARKRCLAVLVHLHQGNIRLCQTVCNCDFYIRFRGKSRQLDIGRVALNHGFQRCFLFVLIVNCAGEGPLIGFHHGLRQIIVVVFRDFLCGELRDSLDCSGAPVFRHHLHALSGIRNSLVKPEGHRIRQSVLVVGQLAVVQILGHGQGYIVAVLHRCRGKFIRSRHCMAFAHICDYRHIDGFPVCGVAFRSFRLRNPVPSGVQMIQQKLAVFASGACVYRIPPFPACQVLK